MRSRPLESSGIQLVVGRVGPHQFNMAPFVTPASFVPGLCMLERYVCDAISTGTHAFIA